MKNFWLSWYTKEDDGEFELHFPWWCSGRRCSDDAGTIVAAVQAMTEAEAVDLVYSAYDTRPPRLEFRFCEEKDVGWTPFNDRFKRSDWMNWSEGGRSDGTNGGEPLGRSSIDSSQCSNGHDVAEPI